MAINPTALMKKRSLTPVRAAFFIAAISVTLAMAAAPYRAVAYVLEGPHVLELSAKAMGSIAAPSNQSETTDLSAIAGSGADRL